MLSCFHFHHNLTVHPRQQSGDEQAGDDAATSNSKEFSREFEQGPPHSTTLHWALYNRRSSHAHQPNPHASSADDHGSPAILSSKTDAAYSMVLMGSNNTSSPLDSFPHTHKSSTSAVMSSDDRATPVLRHCSTPAMNSPWASEKLSAISELEAVFEHRNGVSYASRATQSNLHDPPPSSSSSMASVRLTGTPSRYKKGEALGSGSTGTVYQCLDLETGELLAVKEVLRQDLMEAVEKEAKLMSSLAEHPNIIRYRGMRKDERRPFSGPSEVHLHVFTEWMAGGSVSQLIKAYGPLEEGTARRYTYQILQGLSFLHESRIIHRDIKGSNILLGINGNLKLGDLGSSRQLLLASSISSDAQGDGPSSR